MSRFRFLFSGSGGQGVITAAVILGEAAVIHEGLNAVQSQSYGPEARGGASRAEVIISHDPINFPKVNNANNTSRITLRDQDIVRHQVIVNDLRLKFWYLGEYILIKAIQKIAGQFTMIYITNMRQI